MRLELTGHHLKITPALRQLVNEGLEKLDRLLHDRALSLQVSLAEEKYRVHVEMTLHARGDHFFHGAGSGRDWATALHQALGKVNQQARKQKGKWDDGKRRAVSVIKTADVMPPVEAAPPRRRVSAESIAAKTGIDAAPRVIRARRYEIKSLSVDSAAREAADGDAPFLVFRNESTDSINVLFRRPDGQLGLIETEA